MRSVLLAVRLFAGPQACVARHCVPAASLSHSCLILSFKKSNAVVRGLKTTVSQPQATQKKLFDWSIDEVVEWATKTVKIDPKHAAKLQEQEIRGSALPTMTKQDFERYGIPGGPASELVAAIQKLIATPESKAHKVCNSVNELVEWLNGLNIFPIRDLSTPLVPEQLPLLSSERLYGLVSRADPLRSALRHLVARKKYYLGDKRQYNPLVATQAAPGTGKSYFLDELAKLSPNDVVVQEVDGAAALVASWVPIPITYNQFSRIELDRDFGLDLAQGLAARMLFSFLMDFTSQEKATGALFDMFLRFVAPTLRDSLVAATPYAVCRYILEQSTPFEKSSILLLVDEVLKVGEGQVSAMLRLIGDIQDTFSIRLRSVITSLDVSALRNSQTSSGRSVLFVPLPLFPHSAVLAALADHLKRAPEDELFEFRVLIADCVGHARTLEKLCQLWDSKMKFKYIQEELLKAVPNPEEHRVAVAIAADRLPLDHKLAGRATVEDDIKAGHFINSVPELSISQVVPQLSLLQLRRFAAGGSLAALVSVPARPGRSAEWKAFETFCLHWEVVSRSVRSRDSETILGHRDSKTILGRYLRPSLSYTSALAFHSMKKLDSAIALEDVELEAVPGQITSNLASDMYKPGRIYYSTVSNNPGFDYFYPVLTPDGKYVLVCVECKMSDPTAATTLSTEDIRQKLAKVEAALQPDKSGSFNHRPLERVFVFFMAMRNVTEDALKTAHLAGPNDLIVGVVLNRERLLNLFGPSLYARPEFFADYVESGAAALTKI